MIVWQLVVVSLVAYLLGSVSLSIILSKLMGKGDIREKGSGNAGTTNTFRTLGKLPGIAVFIWDVLKGVIAVVIGRWLIGLGNENVASELMTTYTDLAMVLSAIMAVLGHNFPVYFGFRGGKGVATSLGVILAIEWPIAVACLVFAAVVMILTRMVSLGSIAVAILYPILTFFLGTSFGPSFENRTMYLVFALILAASVLFRHRSNIARIKNGTENKIWKTKAEKLADEKEAAQKKEN